MKKLRNLSVLFVSFAVFSWLQADTTHSSIAFDGTGLAQRDGIITININNRYISMPDVLFGLAFSPVFENRGGDMNRISIGQELGISGISGISGRSGTSGIRRGEMNGTILSRGMADPNILSIIGRGQDN
ncbi:MAG: hypothetical protein HY606_04380 [Planctomycetes bacterium]|nr:hypothetical protein [Planctomycetota bacterium]